jgi:anti-sigma factor RsiW
MTMKDTKPHSVPSAGSPITEADLHAWADQQLSLPRRAEVDAYLAAHPEAKLRVEQWQRQNRLLREWLAPVMDEPLPIRLPLQRESRRIPWRGLAAGVAIAVGSASLAWMARGLVDTRAAGAVYVGQADTVPRFARQAAVAHAVYSPDARRPVEVGGDQEQALVTWLTKRLGAEVKAPGLGTLGYELVGGRLLPGESGPVAQFMYAATDGQRLTLYITRQGAGPEASFRYGQEGKVNQFYWVDKNFGYAVSGEVDRNELMRVSQEVYRQLDH